MNTLNYIGLWTLLSVLVSHLGFGGVIFFSSGDSSAFLVNFKEEQSMLFGCSFHIIMQVISG
jgi:hypothetical protein